MEKSAGGRFSSARCYFLFELALVSSGGVGGGVAEIVTELLLSNTKKNRHCDRAAISGDSEANCIYTVMLFSCTLCRRAVQWLFAS